ncbi:hypothetical protein Ocin01_18919 [Orchesella cincta]|uniref:Uncharacterized protein n=1 Tax=Orchesella cincta TaxID=48709 RepID=A0A1D2M4A0_ORCCI|nr:hypothetical protein Ocin01_18919 [Orchesella cincta]
MPRSRSVSSSSSSSSKDGKRHKRKKSRKSGSSKKKRLDLLETEVSEIKQLVRELVQCQTDAAKANSTQQNSKQTDLKADEDNDSDTQNQDVLELSAVDEDIQELLGEPVKVAENGPDIHPEIATRWNAIAKKGLAKEDREKIRKKFIPPSNGCFGGPPLNMELNKAVNAFTRGRDEELFRIQKNMETSITGLGQLLSSFLDEKSELTRNDYIAMLSDSARFLVGTQYQVSAFRRKQIRLNIKDVKEAQAMVKISQDITKGTEKRPSQFMRDKPKEPAKPRGSTSSVQARSSLNFQRPLQTRTFRP